MAFMIYFDEESAKVEGEAKSIIADAAATALRYSQYRLEVIGHDDSVLPDQQSMTFSQERSIEVATSGYPLSRMTYHLKIAYQKQRIET